MEQRQGILEEGQRRWEGWFAQSPDGILLLDDSGHYVDANPATLPLLGYTRAELLKLGYWDIIPPDTHNQAHQVWSAVLAGGRATDEWTIVRKDGQLREVRYRCLINFRPGLHLMLLEDITPRKQAETQQRYMAQLFLAVTDAIIATDMQHNIQAWNPAAEAIYGWKAAEVLGRPIAEVLATEFEGSDREAALAAVYANGEYRAEVWQRRKDGSRFPVEAAVRPLHDAQQRPYGLVAINRDISARKATGAALRRQTEFLQTIFDHIPVMIDVFDAQGRMRLANRALEQTLGWTLDELRAVGRDIFVESLPDQADRQAVHDFINSAPPGPADFKLRVRGGQMIDTNWSVVRLSDGTTIGLGQDITERKQAEAEIHNAAARTRALLRVAGALNARLDLEHVVNTVCAETAAVMRVPIATVWLYDEARDVYYYAGGLGVPAHLTACLQVVPRGYYDSHFEAGATLSLVSDLRGLTDAPNSSLIEALDLRTNLVAAMVHEGQPIGYLRLATTGAVRAFSAAELALLQGLADQSALALQNARLFASASEQSERLRALSARLVETQELERRHIARELHDEIGQQLTGLQVALEVTSRSLPPAAQAGLGQARRMVEQLMDQVHDLSLALRPTMLDDLGLLPALLWHFERYTQQTGVPVRFEQRGAEKRLPAQAETAAYRVIQEALTNVARHAGATEATVRVWVEDGLLGVLIEDAGAGFDVAAALAARASSGLSGMQERATLLGGTLTLESAPGAGTQITLELPLSTSGAA